MNNTEVMNLNNALQAVVEVYEERVQVLDSLLREAESDLVEAKKELQAFEEECF